MGEPTASSSSGLAMRRPPSDCERLRSPDMLRGRSQCRWPAERRGGWRAGRGTSESCGGAWGGGCRQRLYSERGRCSEEVVDVLLLGTRRRYSSLGGGGGGGGGGVGGAKGGMWCKGGVQCNAMGRVWVRVQCIAVYIRVDRRRADCFHLKSAEALTACTKSANTSRCADRKTLN